jgi:hypothetical protein
MDDQQRNITRHISGLANEYASLNVGVMRFTEQQVADVA